MNPIIARCVLAALIALGASTAAAQKVSPKPAVTPSPGYPEELTDTGLNGQAEVDITVKADGSVTDAQLAMATHRAFGRVALAAVKEWKFEPGQKDGVAVDVKVGVPFRFTAPPNQQVNAYARRKVFVDLPSAALTQKDFGAKLKVKQPARPMYPRTGQGPGRDVTVQVNFVVGPDGHTLNPTVPTDAPKDFVIPALQAVAMMTYEPPLKAGQPVYVEATTKLEFTNERGGGFDGGGGRGGGGMRGGGGGGRGGGGF
jgi:TonB family protein